MNVYKEAQCWSFKMYEGIFLLYGRKFNGYDLRACEGIYGEAFCTLYILQLSMAKLCKSNECDA